MHQRVNMKTATISPSGKMAQKHTWSQLTLHRRNLDDQYQVLAVLVLSGKLDNCDSTKRDPPPRDDAPFAVEGERAGWVESVFTREQKPRKSGKEGW